MALWPGRTLSQVMSPICSAHLTSSRSAGRGQTSNKSTTLASTERSPPMLKLTTSTAEQRLLHHHHTGDRSRTQSGTNLSLDLVQHFRHHYRRKAKAQHPFQHLLSVKVQMSEHGATRRSTLPKTQMSKNGATRRSNQPKPLNPSKKGDHEQVRSDPSFS